MELIDTLIKMSREAAAGEVPSDQAWRDMAGTLIKLPMPVLQQIKEHAQRRGSLPVWIMISLTIALIEVAMSPEETKKH